MTGGAEPDEGAELSPAHELAELARLLRAGLEWHRVTGGVGLPPADRAQATSHVAEEPVPAAAEARREAPPVPGTVSATAAAGDTAASGAPLQVAAVSASVSADELDERRRRLVLLEETVRGCTACALHQGRTQTVFARGDGSSGLCFVGEGPGADEDAQGYPFVGVAGQLLDRMIGAMGFSRDEVYVCNIVKCRPPSNRKPEPDEMSACSPYLAEQLSLLAPSVIVALGATAVQGLLGTSEGITRMRGTWKLYQGKVPVMPTFHPAYLLRTPSAKREVWADLQEVLRHMGRSAPRPAR